MKTNDNIFLTGQAGTGKSTTIKNYIEWANDQGLNVALTASTGVAAVNIGGVTIHSFLGSKLAGSIEEYNHTKVNPGYWKEIKDYINLIDVLVIDEVSMLTADYIDMIDYILKKATGENLPFGDKKIIFTGDFLQLPPVSNRQRSFAFESKAWFEANVRNINLTKIHRQEEQEFTSMLSKVRFGETDKEVIEYFQDLNTILENDDDSVKLFSRNINVDAYNQSRLDELDGASKYYEADITGEKTNMEQLKKRVLANEVLELKIGAKVMALKNDLDLKYVNGSTGTVINLNEDSVKVKFDNGKTVNMKADFWEQLDIHGNSLACFEQIPLKLAYAITVHKSQGMTIDNLTIDCQGIFEEGQFYVAVSRASSSKGLKLMNFRPEHIKSNRIAVAFYKRFEK